MFPKLVIFDCDGVLVDSETIANDVLIRNLEHYGLSLNFDESMEMFAGTSDEYVQSTAKQMGARLPHDWLEEVDRETFAELRKGVACVEGIEGIIDRLDTLAIPYCVASNGSEDKMAITLGQNGLLKKFEGAVFSAHTLGISKPDPGLFLHAAEKFNQPPDACIVIEDSLSGVKAARSANMKCYGYAPHNNGEELALEGAEVFHNMSDLPGIMGI